MTMTHISKFRSVPTILTAALAGLLLAGTQFAQILGITSASSTAADFRGSATAVSGVAMGSSLSIVNSGTLSVSSGVQEASSVGESVAGVFAAGTLHATAIGQVNMAATEASAAD